MKKPYACDFQGCTKTYTTRFSLRRHIASHSTVKQHVCGLCFKTFTLAQYLKEHMHTHTKQKPFKCDYPNCNKAYFVISTPALVSALNQSSLEISPSPSLSALPSALTSAPQCYSMLNVSEGKILATCRSISWCPSTSSPCSLSLSSEANSLLALSLSLSL